MNVMYTNQDIYIYKLFRLRVNYPEEMSEQMSAIF